MDRIEKPAKLNKIPISELLNGEMNLILQQSNYQKQY
jgi:hypothetical protein